MYSANGDAERVQTSRGNDKAHAIEERTLAGRKLGAVRVSVKDGEEADQRGRDAERGPDFETRFMR